MCIFGLTSPTHVFIPGLHRVLETVLLIACMRDNQNIPTFGRILKKGMYHEAIPDVLGAEAETGGGSIVVVEKGQGLVVYMRSIRSRRPREQRECRKENKEAALHEGVFSHLDVVG